MYKAIHALVLTSVVTLPALAGDGPLSGNLSLTSNYLFRGISQTQDGPAVQGGIDYAHPSGFYVGTWASNVAWVKENGLKDDNRLEIDLYGGYKGEAGPIAYDLGLIRYHYPGRLTAGKTTPNTTESMPTSVGVSCPSNTVMSCPTTSSAGRPAASARRAAATTWTCLRPTIWVAA